MNRIIFVALMCVLLQYVEAKGQEIPREPPSTPTPEQQKALEAGAPKIGEIFQYGADSTFKKVDMTKFFVLAIEWQPPGPFADYQIGLRADGIVVWRKAAK